MRSSHDQWGLVAKRVHLDSILGIMFSVECSISSDCENTCTVIFLKHLKQIKPDAKDDYKISTNSQINQCHLHRPGQTWGSSPSSPSPPSPPQTTRLRAPASCIDRDSLVLPLSLSAPSRPVAMPTRTSGRVATSCRRCRGPSVASSWRGS